MTSILEKRQNIHQELKKRKQEFESLEKQVESLESAASVGSAAAMIAHEINNILTPIGNYAELALRNMDDKKLIEKALIRSRDNCRKASKVAEAILNISNGAKEAKEKTNLREIVSEIFECLCRDFNKDGITVKIEIDGALTLSVHKVRFQQVLMNLIINARDAMLGSGGILIIRAKNQNNLMCIEVCDTGCGIEPENISKIFESFFTTKASKDGQSGTGLGLAFCKKVVEQHEGTIFVESEPGRGSVFRITLPAKY